MKIALVGPYPPPFGGISIHIQRLEESLIKSGIKCTVYDAKDKHCRNINGERKKIILSKFCLLTKEKIIHFHSSGHNLNMLIKALFYLILGKKVVITYHSLREKNKVREQLSRRLINLISKLNAHIIAVNSHIKDNFVKIGINKKKIKVISAFIPFIENKEEIAEIPKEVWTFIKRHSPIISANAFKIVFYNNEDLYGIDMCIKLCDSLKSKYPKVGFIFCLPDIGDYDYFNEMKQRIKEKGIESNFLFQTKPCQLYPILMKSDVFVRPTNTDGDAISLREAFYFKKPSVASDVVPRPKETVLFKNRDINDFTFKVKDVLNNYEEYKKRLRGTEPESTFEETMKVYQRLSR